MLATPLSPAMLAKASKTDVVPDAIVLTGSASSLGIAAAEVGFKMMERIFMDKLIREVDLKFEKTTTPRPLRTPCAR